MSIISMTYLPPKIKAIPKKPRETAKFTSLSKTFRQGYPQFQWIVRNPLKQAAAVRDQAREPHAHGNLRLSADASLSPARHDKRKQIA